MSLSNQIAIFGTGSSEFSFRRSFSEVDPIFYLDNNQEKQYRLHRNRLVLPPELLGKINNENIQIIIASEFYEEISEQLEGYGFKEHEDYFSHVKLLFETTDYFLVSFMKCGRTWLRFLIGHLIEELHSFSEEDRLIYTDTCRKYSSKVPVITAIHDDNPHLKEAANLEKEKKKYKGKKVLFMVRDPRDVAVSLFYHMKYRAKKYEGDIDKFILKHVETIVNYYNIWYENRDLPDDFHIIRYEDLHVEPLISFKKVVRFLGIDASDTVLNKAVERSNFKNMKKYEASNKLKNKQLKPTDKDDKRSFKVRKGKAGGYEEELDKEIIDKLNKEYIKKLNPIFGYSI